MSKNYLIRNPQSKLNEHFIRTYCDSLNLFECNSQWTSKDMPYMPIRVIWLQLIWNVFSNRTLRSTVVNVMALVISILRGDKQEYMWHDSTYTENRLPSPSEPTGCALGKVLTCPWRLLRPFIEMVDIINSSAKNYFGNLIGRINWRHSLSSNFYIYEEERI